jgi:hypothetical protein
MGARMGIERVIIQQLFEIQTESGPNGERVQKPLNDDKDLVRFVGNWANSVGSSGVFPFTSVSGDFAEFTFFGTGLNLLVLLDGTSRSFSYTVDGGSLTAYSYPASGSNTLTTRNYSPNQVAPIVSGLSAGIHTVRIQSTSSNTFVIYGFEVLNETSTVRVNSGTIVKDQRQFSLEAVQALSAKPSTLTGSRGGRVIVYNQGGVIGTAVQAVNASQQNVNSADHSNEEIVRVYQPREFGANRSDDFSTITTSGSDRAFVLDDGTTALAGSSVLLSTVSGLPEGIALSAVSNSIQFTFVGTGLDVEYRGLNGAAATNHVWSIDGTDIGFPQTDVLSNTKVIRRKVVSGLPYGTHVFRYTVTGATPEGQVFSKFIVYQPKKPAVPSGAIELADYNVMADFSPVTTTGVYTVGTGVLKKYIQNREGTLVGTWNVSSPIAPGNYTSGQWAQGTTNGGYIEYTFFGTGFEWRFYTDPSYTSSATLSIDGLTATSTNFPAATFSVTSPATYNTSTGVLAENVTNGSGRALRVSGLTLAKHTVRLTNNTTSSLDIASFDVITPIHAPRSNFQADLQNTLPVGSCSLSDSRQYLPANLSPQKAWAQAVGVTSNPTTTSTTLVAMPDMSLTIKTQGGKCLIHYSLSSSLSAGSNTYGVQLFVDGVPVGTQKQIMPFTAGAVVSVSDQFLVNLSPGTHKVDLYWYASAGTFTAITTLRNLSVEEL